MDFGPAAGWAWRVLCGAAPAARMGMTRFLKAFRPEPGGTRPGGMDGGNKFRPVLCSLCLPDVFRGSAIIGDEQ